MPDENRDEQDFGVELPPRYKDVDFSVTLPPWFSPGAGVSHD